MSKIKLKNKSNHKSSDGMLFPSVVCGIWVFLMLVVFPVFVTDYYFNILNTKAIFCVSVNCALIVVIGIWAAFNWNKFAAAFTKKKLNALDIAMIALGGIYIVATLVSDYKAESFFGSNARYGGMAMYCLYVTSYFLVSRLWKFNKPTMRWFLLSCIFVAFFGITDFFKCNIMGFKTNIEESLLPSFTSTIGNINTYTSFLAIPMAYAGTMFVMTKEDRLSTATYAVALAVMLFGMVTGRSDNAYLAIMGFFGILPFVAFKTRQGFRRYILSLGILFAMITIAILICKASPDKVYVPGGVFTVLSRESTIVYILTAVFLIAGGLMCYFDVKKSVVPEALMPAWLRWAWIGIVVVVAAAGISILVIANTAFDKLPAILQDQSMILVLDNSFGGGRGYTWFATVDLWKNALPWYQKIFGAGPETSGIYMVNLKYQEMVETTHLIFDSPHNEYLQMFFNLGIVGLIIYVGTFVSAIVLSFKNRESKFYPYSLACAFIIIAHMFECVVNIVVPIDCGLLFAFIALAGYFIYHNQE